MNKEVLERIENALTKEEIIARAKTLRPIAEFKECGGMRYWVDGGRIHNESYTWDLKRIKPTGYLREIARIKTYHYCGHPSLIKPSVDECVIQCPTEIVGTAVAFMIEPGSGVYDYALDRHVCETVYFAGDLPGDIRNREIEW